MFFQELIVFTIAFLVGFVVWLRVRRYFPRE